MLTARGNVARSVTVMSGSESYFQRRRNVGEHSRLAGRPADLMTMAEVLAELQVARSTFDTWRALGSAPECIKLPNGQIRIRRCAFDSWLTFHSDKDAS